MELNPYAKFAAGRDGYEVVAATPALLHKAACALTPEQVEAPWQPGKWSVREICAHLADCEMVFGFRLRQTLAETAPVLQPFDQDRWALRYAGYTLPEALALFKATREWNVKLIAAATAEDRARVVTHPERGTMTFWTIVETMAGHDLNHLAQVQAVAERQA